MKKSVSAYPYVVWAILFTVIPLVMVLFYSVYDQSTGTFTLHYIQKCFDPLYLKVILYSFKLALYCTVLCLLIGYPVAMILAKTSFEQKDTLLFLVIAPMWMNFLLRTYAWLTILENNGIINKILGFFNLGPYQLLYNEGAVLLGMVYNYLPFMILPIYTVLAKQDKNVIQASYDLGANKLQTFIRVELPLSMPGVFSGIAMVFMPAVTTFVISKLLGGGQQMLIGNIIEKQFMEVSSTSSFGGALSLILIIVILVSMAVTNKLNPDDNSEGGGLI